MANRKLGRTTDIRMSMLKTLTTDLIMYGKITTTETRAKEVKKIADSIIALATESRQKDMPSRLNARRKIMTKINKVKINGENVDLPSKLFNEIAPKYTDRVGGYTRIIKAEPRRGDNAPMAVLMLV